MISTIQRNLRAYMGNSTPEERERMNMTEGQCTGSRAIIQAAVKEQEEIGWKHFFSGRLSKKWQEALELDQKAREAQNPTAKITLISSLIRIIWEARLSL